MGARINIGIFGRRLPVAQGVLAVFTRIDDIGVLCALSGKAVSRYGPGQGKTTRIARIAALRKDADKCR